MTGSAFSRGALAAARALNRRVNEVFSEDRVYRIDHYLGKETVQNLLVFRFANAIFEPVWNRNYIANVQITVAETVSVFLQVMFFKLTGRRIFRCTPLHHHFEFKGWSETRVTLSFWVASALFALVSVVSLRS